MFHQLYYVNQITLNKAQMVDIAMKPRGSYPSPYAVLSWWVIERSHVLSMGLVKTHRAFRYYAKQLYPDWARETLPRL